MIFQFMVSCSLLAVVSNSLPALWVTSTKLKCIFRVSLQTRFTVSRYRYRTHIGPSWSLLCPSWILLICQQSSLNKFEFKRGKFIEGWRREGTWHDTWTLCNALKLDSFSICYVFATHSWSTLIFSGIILFSIDTNPFYSLVDSWNEKKL